MYKYKLKILDRSNKVIFEQEVLIDGSRLAENIPEFIERVDRLNVMDRKPTDTYELVGITKEKNHEV